MKYLKFLFYFLIFQKLNSQQIINYNQIFNWTNDTLVGSYVYDNIYNEIWGGKINDIEFAVIGSTAGTHIFDISDPENSSEIFFFPGSHNGPHVIHRDYHDYNGFLYTVCDEGNSSLQVIDIRNLPYSANIIYDSDEFIKRAHNIFIDEVSNKLYACSVLNGKNENSSIVILDINNPFLPLKIMDYEIPETSYSAHDIWVNNDTGFVNNGYDGFFVINFSSANPSIIGSLTSYPDKGYNHSGWPNSDMSLYVMADENWGYDLKILDISNLENINVISTFNSEIHKNSIAHNVMVKNNLAYISYYHDGLQVYDISIPENPTKVGSFNTYLLDDHEETYRGAWGVYSFLPSNNILISDMQFGLYVIGENYLNIEQIKNIDIKVFPNPSYSDIKIIFPNNQNIYYISLTNFLGKSIFNKKIKNEKYITVSDLCKGIYNINIYNHSISMNKKLIIQ